MTKVIKKLSALLLTLALVLTMMPMVAAPVFAEDDAAFGLAINGTEVNASITVQQLKDNATGPQVFPFAAGQGKQWQYVVADGTSYEAVLKMITGLDSLDKLSSSVINWNNANDEEQGKFDLPIEDLLLMTQQFKLVDQDGNDIVGAFNGDSITSAEAVALEGAVNVTPIVAYKYHMYGTYEEAKAAIEDGSWESEAKEEIRPFVGGNLSKETFLKKDGGIKMGMLNFTGKFSIVANEPGYKLNIKDYPVELPESAELVNVSMTEGDTAMQLSSSIYTKAEIEYLGGVWECDDAEVIAVDEFGSITPLKAGTTKVYLVTYPDGDPANGTVLGEWTVTVAAKAAPAVQKPVPAAPIGLKVKNVKKKSAQITWAASADAETYEVYRSTKKKKGFKKVATVTGTSYKNKKLKKGKTYYFKVKAVNSTGASGFSAVKKVKIKK